MGAQSRLNRDRRRAQSRPPGVAIAYISPGQVSHYFVESLTKTILLGYQQGWLTNILPEWSSANVSAARNTVTDRFLDTDSGEWLLWVDSDMQWDADAVTDLLAVADRDERPIVSGLCFGNSGDAMYPTIYMGYRTDDGQFTTVRVRDYPRDTLLRVAATGAAFLLVHRRVLQAMREHARASGSSFDRAFPYFAESAGNGKPVGEDITFCIRAGAWLGVPVHVHTGVRIGHHKSALLTEEEFAKQLPDEPPPDVGLVVPTAGAHPDLVAGIVAASGLPPERVVIVTNGEAGPDPAVAATWLHDDGPINVHRWWNAGLDLLAERGCRRVAVLNDDVVIAPGTLSRLAWGMGSATLAVPDLGPAGNPGHCWMLDVTRGVRADESYRWWCGDLQLMVDAERSGGVAHVPGVWLAHLHANEATQSSPELLALAEADCALYDARHPDGPWARATEAEAS